MSCDKCNDKGWIITKEEDRQPAMFNCEMGGTCKGVWKEYCNHCLSQDIVCECKAGQAIERKRAVLEKFEQLEKRSLKI